MKEIEKPLKSDNMVENVGPWDAEFIDMDDASIFQLVSAANYLMIQPLLDLHILLVVKRGVWIP